MHCQLWWRQSPATVKRDRNVPFFLLRSHVAAKIWCHLSWETLERTSIVPVPMSNMKRNPAWYQQNTTHRSTTVLILTYDLICLYLCLYCLYTCNILQRNRPIHLGNHKDHSVLLAQMKANRKVGWRFRWHGDLLLHLQKIKLQSLDHPVFFPWSSKKDMFPVAFETIWDTSF